MRNVYFYCVRHRNGWGSSFGPRPTHCATCGAALPVPPTTGGAAGYGCSDEETIPAHSDAPPLKKGETITRSKAHCYACCAARERASMIENGRAVLYLTFEDSAPRGFHIMGRYTSVAYCKTREEAEELLRPGERVEPDVTRVWFASDWTGALKFRIGGAIRHSRAATFGGRIDRKDVWFTGPDGAPWHGVNKGDNEILRCKRLKRKPQ